MQPGAVHAISPLDGRYAAAVAPLRGYFSEAALINERVRVEALWLEHLATAAPMLAGARLSASVQAAARGLAADPGAEAVTAIKRIETRINHDVKAVE